MYRYGIKMLLLLLVGLLTAGLVSGRADAQGYRREYKSGWYVDPVFSSPGYSAVGSSYTSGHLIDAPCPSCEIAGHAAAMQGHAYTSSGYAGIAGSATNCPPPTNALLRVWVDDCAMVWVNGQRTKPQRLAGVNRGSRIFSLTGLAPVEIQEAVVHVLMLDGQLMTEKKLVQAGGSYVVRFPNMEDFAGGLPHGFGGVVPNGFDGAPPQGNTKLVPAEAVDARRPTPAAKPGPAAELFPAVEPQAEESSANTDPFVDEPAPTVAPSAEPVPTESTPATDATSPGQ